MSLLCSFSLGPKRALAHKPHIVATWSCISCGSAGMVQATSDTTSQEMLGFCVERHHAMSPDCKHRTPAIASGPVAPPRRALVAASA